MPFSDMEIRRRRSIGKGHHNDGFLMDQKMLTCPGSSCTVEVIDGLGGCLPDNADGLVLGQWRC
jgi:hypothetical protein